MAPFVNIESLMNRSMQGKLSSSAMTSLNVWIYFNLIGNTILLPLVVITFLFSKTAKRHPTLVNLCITWIFSGVFSLLLFYSKQHVGPEPDTGLCIVQASLLYGIIPMWSVAVLALVYYMLRTLKGDSLQSRLFKGLPMIIMLSAPYVAQCSFTVAALLLAFQKPYKVGRHQSILFCSFIDDGLFLATTIFTLIVCAFIIALEINLAVVIHRNWRSVRNAGLPSELPLPLITRVLVFGVYVAIGMGVNILRFFGKLLPGNIYAATAGSFVFLIFGTQADVFRAWCFWKKGDNDPLPTSIPPPNSSPSMETTSRQSRQAPSLDTIFRTSRVETNSRRSTRTSRQPSTRTSRQPSTRRCSTKNFIRIPDGTEGIVPTSRHSKEAVERVTQEMKSADIKLSIPDLPEPAKVLLRNGSIGETILRDRVGKLDTVTRKRRKDDPPRPKGPRMANFSSANATLRPHPPALISRPSEQVTVGLPPPFLNHHGHF